MATVAIAVMEIDNLNPATLSKATDGAYITIPICIVCYTTKYSLHPGHTKQRLLNSVHVY